MTFKVLLSFAAVCLSSLNTFASLQEIAPNESTAEVTVFSASYDMNSRQLILQIDSGDRRNDGTKDVPVAAPLTVGTIELISENVGCTSALSCPAEISLEDRWPERFRIQMTTPSPRGQMDIPIAVDPTKLNELVATRALTVKKTQDRRYQVFFDRKACPRPTCR